MSYNLTKRELVFIKRLSNKIPPIVYHTYRKSKLPGLKLQWFISWCFTRKWPNGEYIFSGWFVEWVNKKYGAVTHPVNHYRRMKKAMQRNGLPGVRHYLNNIRVPEPLIIKWLKDY